MVHQQNTQTSRHRYGKLTVNKHWKNAAKTNEISEMYLLLSTFLLYEFSQVADEIRFHKRHCAASRNGFHPTWPFSACACAWAATCARGLAAVLVIIIYAPCGKFSHTNPNMCNSIMDTTLTCHNSTGSR